MAAKETISVRAPQELDQFNDPVGPEQPWRDVPGATVVPRSSQEDDRRGMIITSGFMVALPGRVTDTTGLEVLLTDRHEFRIRGEVYQVEGAVGNFGRKIILYTERAS